MAFCVMQYRARIEKPQWPSQVDLESIARRSTEGLSSPDRYSAALHSGRCSALLGFVIMLHSYDYISLFVSCFDIPVGLGNLFQRIASIYDRFYLSRLNKLFDED